MTQGDTLLTVRDVAHRLGVPVSWVYARVESPDSDLPHVRIGRYVRFEPAAIEAYIAARRRGGCDQEVRP